MAEFPVNPTRFDSCKSNGIPEEHFPWFLKEDEFRFNLGSPAAQLNILKRGKLNHLI